MIPIYDFDKLTPEQMLNRDIRAEENVEAAVKAILAEVRQSGDQALLSCEKRFDGVELDALEVTEQELEEAWEQVGPQMRETLTAAADNIRAFHSRQIHSGFAITDRPGIVLGQRYTPIERVGICVPRSPEAFPSTVLMNVIPAKLAGVRDIILVSPPDESGKIGAAALAAARLAGATRIFKVGGAQAVAALAYGTETVPKVDKIVGPGGIFVATAKRLVFGAVDIDMIAGPSEILVLADSGCDPRFVAADLLSQAEHDKLASPVLVTDSPALAKAVQAELEVQVEQLPRRDIARASLEQNGKIIVTDSLEKAVEAANRIAPEHLELCVEDPFALLSAVRNAGSIFLGRSAPEALGDYFAGPNHTLPTSGTARFSSPLGVDDFVKRSSFLYYSPEALRAVKDQVAAFAEEEGLHAHARSVTIRFEDSADPTKGSDLCE